MPQTPASWYVQVSGQVYGPYNAATMQAFIQEGRIVSESLISANPINGFSEAKNSPFFQPTELTSFAAQSAPSPAQTVRPYEPIAAVPEASYPPSVFLIMAEINSENAMKFLHKLQKLGTAQRIGDTVWLLKTSMSVMDLKLALSAPLTRQDRLFILDTVNNEPAWHNIGADMDERIREMWEES